MHSGSANHTIPVEVLEPSAPAPALLPALRSTGIGLADAFAYSSGLAAAVGGAITYAVSESLEAPGTWHSAALVASAAFFIYNLDRIRDVDRDGASSPSRSTFIVRRRWVLARAAAVAALGVAGLIATAPTSVALLAVPIGTVGLFHRRLKRGIRWKVAYVASAWTAACVGIPWLWTEGSHGIESALWALGFVGPSLVANLVASNLRDGKLRESPWRPRRTLAFAFFLAIGAAALVLVAPDWVSPLAWIPAVEATALGFFRSSERYAHFAIDGALLAGALLAVT